MGYATDGNGGLDENGAFSISTCFTAGTLVHTKTGTKKIEEIQVGDQVLSWDESEDEFEYNRVSETYIRQTDKIYKLTYENGSSVETTNTHPFYIDGKGWVKAEKLQVGDKSILSNEERLTLHSIEIELRQTTVYNFQVENAHTYFVSDVAILVHNADGYENMVNRYSEARLSIEKDFSQYQELKDKTLEEFVKAGADLLKGTAGSILGAGIEGGTAAKDLAADSKTGPLYEELIAHDGEIEKSNFENDVKLINVSKSENEKEMKILLGNRTLDSLRESDDPNDTKRYLKYSQLEGNNLDLDKMMANRTEKYNTYMSKLADLTAGIKNRDFGANFNFRRELNFDAIEGDSPLKHSQIALQQLAEFSNDYRNYLGSAMADSVSAKTFDAQKLVKSYNDYLLSRGWRPIK
ncbi:hypothetical protein A0128_19700 [Leptospira tipperaryensis]|uniref:Hint domain-containing protein n=1 Tax=Leptospira tipperaryensis TaxID=2564040 RepID=A0A1D7V346_9LEPT|nr:polymorphic toxin-type HINT domain-containing protein [Leptospira tipperaryensis]AOP36254.1 hypothetical protein A0128_19700 [Leptospira tipperaryensis]